MKIHTMVIWIMTV